MIGMGFRDKNTKEIERLERSILCKVIDNRLKNNNAPHKFERITNTSIFAESKDHPKISFESKKAYDNVYRLSCAPYTKPKPRESLRQGIKPQKGPNRTLSKELAPLSRSMVNCNDSHAEEASPKINVNLY